MFNMTIEQKSLMKALSFLEGGIGKSAPYLYMNTESAGIVQMFTTDGTQYTTVDMISSSTSSTNEDCPILDFKKFKTIVSTIPESEFVEVKDNGSGSVNISYGIRKPMKLNGLNIGRAQKLSPNLPSANEITLPANKMYSIAKNASIVVDKDNTTVIYRCMRVEVSGYDINATALDYTNKRIFCQKEQAVVGNRNGVIMIEAPRLAKVISNIEPFFDSIIINQDASIISVEPTDIKSGLSPWFSSLTYYVRQVAGNFPTTISQMFANAPTEYAEVNSEELEATLGKVKAIHENIVGIQSSAVDIHVHDDLMEVNYASTYGEISDEIALENQMSMDFTCKVNYLGLLDIIKSFGTKTFYISEMPGTAGNYILRNDLSNANCALFGIAGIVTTSTP